MGRGGVRRGEVRGGVGEGDGKRSWLLDPELQ